MSLLFTSQSSLAAALYLDRFISIDLTIETNQLAIKLAMIRYQASEVVVKRTDKALLWLRSTTTSCALAPTSAIDYEAYF